MARSSRFIAIACFTSLIALGACSRQDGRQMAKPNDSQISATNTTVAPSTSAGELTDDVAAIDTEPAVQVRDGGVIANGYDAELDELRGISTDNGTYLLGQDLTILARLYHTRGEEINREKTAAIIEQITAAAPLFN